MRSKGRDDISTILIDTFAKSSIFFINGDFQ